MNLQLSNNKKVKRIKRMERHCMKLLEGWFGSYKHVFSELVGRAGTRSIHDQCLRTKGRSGDLIGRWKVCSRYVVMEDLEEGDRVKWRSTVRNQSASG